MLYLYSLTIGKLLSATKAASVFFLNWPLTTNILLQGLNEKMAVPILEAIL